MSDQKNKGKKSTKSEDGKDRTKEIWLAGLGALAKVEEEGSKLFRNLVDRGSEFEKKQKDHINEVWDEVSGQYKKFEGNVGENVDKAEAAAERNMKSLISGLGIPTRKEMDELSQKIDMLSAKLDKMASKSGGSTPVKNKKQTAKKGK